MTRTRVCRVVKSTGIDDPRITHTMSAAATTTAYSGRTVLDQRGRWIGTVQHVHLNDRTGRPEWVTIRTGRLVNTRHIAPLAGSTIGHDDLQLPYDLSAVRQAPQVMDADHMNVHDQLTLYSHYLQNLSPRK